MYGLPTGRRSGNRAAVSIKGDASYQEHMSCLKFDRHHCSVACKLSESVCCPTLELQGSLSTYKSILYKKMILWFPTIVESISMDSPDMYIHNMYMYIQYIIRYKNTKISEQVTLEDF